MGDKAVKQGKLRRPREFSSSVGAGIPTDLRIVESFSCVDGEFLSVPMGRRRGYICNRAGSGGLAARPESEIVFRWRSS
jgi:hypothetical protein